MVAGNHEFYGSTLEQETQALQKAAASTSHVNFLENEILEIGGVVFLGCCLWTDFALFGVAQRTLNIIRAERQMSDYSLIHSQQRNDQPAVPEQTFALHRESLKFLREGLERFANQRVVVVTHHAPSARSISKLHQGSPLNPAFASPLEWLFEKFQPTLWIHGHTHGPADYTIGNTRILANCAGYPGELSDDDFRPDLIVEIAPE
jgi:predicted phosphohydrolase